MFHWYSLDVSSENRKRAYLFVCGRKKIYFLRRRRSYIIPIGYIPLHVIKAPLVVNFLLFTIRTPYIVAEYCNAQYAADE